MTCMIREKKTIYSIISKEEKNEFSLLDEEGQEAIPAERIKLVPRIKHRMGLL